MKQSKWFLHPIQIFIFSIVAVALSLFLYIYWYVEVSAGLKKAIELKKEKRSYKRPTWIPIRFWPPRPGW